MLVADDIVMNRDLIRAFFFGTDHELIEAGNGREAVDLARKERPDIILMDVRMPVMDGLQATRILKADEARSKQFPSSSSLPRPCRPKRRNLSPSAMDSCANQ